MVGTCWNNFEKSDGLRPNGPRMPKERLLWPPNHQSIPLYLPSRLRPASRHPRKLGPELGAGGRNTPCRACRESPFIEGGPKMFS